MPYPYPPLAGGPCGSGRPVTPQPTSLQCLPDKQGCPPDYYCSTVYDTDLGYSVCLQVSAHRENRCLSPGMLAGGS